MAEREVSGPVRSGAPFWLLTGALGGAYALFLALLLGATALHTSPPGLLAALSAPEIRYAIRLSLLTCTVAAAFSVLVAVPAGYVLSRARFPGRAAMDALFDVPIVLPPMVLGLSLLIFFQTSMGRAIERVVPLTWTVYGVVLAQFTIGAAFAIRTMRGTFDHLSPRPEHVALTLGATRLQAVWHVTLPAARRGIFASFCVAWARGMGEFGPILVFAGATRMRTEVLPTTVWLELSVGNLDGAVAVSLLMIGLSLLVLSAVRMTGDRL